MCERLQYVLTSSQSKVHQNDKVQCTVVLPLDICTDVCHLSCDHIAEVLYKALQLLAELSSILPNHFYSFLVQPHSFGDGSSGAAFITWPQQ